MLSSLSRVAALSVLSGLALLLTFPAQAGIVLNTTRVIYSGADKEVGLIVHNTGTGEILAQSWLEASADAAPAHDSLFTPSASADVPFAITPALSRMAGEARQLVRIIYSGEGLATDRESALWLNVQEIPQAGGENELQIAIRQRIKLFYRPVGLTEDPLKAAQALQWQVRDGQLEVNNPGSYHVSMIKLEARRGTQVVFQEDARMLAPQQRWRWPLQHKVSDGPLALAFISINDFGAQEPYQATVTDARVTQAAKAERRPDSR